MHEVVAICRHGVPVAAGVWLLVVAGAACIVSATIVGLAIIAWVIDATLEFVDKANEWLPPTAERARRIADEKLAAEEWAQRHARRRAELEAAGKTA